MKYFRILILIIPVFLVQIVNVKAQVQSITHSLTDDSTTVSFEFVDNRMFVETGINDKKGYFILDTGGFYGLNEDFANLVGLEAISTFNMRGAGSEVMQGWRTMVDSVQIGEIYANNVPVVVININAIRDNLNLPYLDGVMGAELFRQFVVDIDYPNRSVTFIKPKAFKADKSWAVFELSFNGHMPVVDGSILGVDGDFVIDTGDRSELTIFKNFADTHNLRNQLMLSDTTATGYGIGGPIYAQTANLEKFFINDLEVGGVTLRIPTLEEGGFANSDMSGSIGSGLLKPFRVIFDYGNQKLYIKQS